MCMHPHRDCEYPQEVVLCLECLCNVSSIVLMAHERLTPNKVEVFVTDSDTAPYQRLG